MFAYICSFAGKSNADNYQPFWYYISNVHHVWIQSIIYYAILKLVARVFTKYGNQWILSLRIYMNFNHEIYRLIQYFFAKYFSMFVIFCEILSSSLFLISASKLSVLPLCTARPILCFANKSPEINWRLPIFVGYSPSKETFLFCFKLKPFQLSLVQT